MERRSWWPDVEMIADQLVKDYRDADPRPVELRNLYQGAIDAHRAQGDMDALGTIASWQALAADHGEEFTEDDWVTLAQVLAWRLSAYAPDSGDEPVEIPDEPPQGLA